MPAAQIETAIGALEARGYTDRGKLHNQEHRHAPALWHDDWPTTIELHTRISDAEKVGILRSQDVFARAVASAHPAVATPSVSLRTTMDIALVLRQPYGEVDAELVQLRELGIVVQKKDGRSHFWHIG